MLAGAAPPASEKDDMNYVAAVVEPGIQFPADPVGTQSLTVRDGTLSPTDPAGILFPADLAKPTTVGVVGLADAGILFPAFTEGILFPPDPAGMLLAADLAKSATVGVADLANAGILFPAVSEGIPFSTDPGKLLSPADHNEPCAVGVTDLDELSELGTFAGKMEDEAQSPPCCYVGDGIDFWDPVLMVKELGCRVDELPVYYGGDFGYPDYYDDQSELSDYEDPRIFFWR